MKLSIPIAGSCLLLLLMSQAWSARVYSWTDAEGITHFSETPPDDVQIDSVILEVEPAPVASTPAGDDYYSVANQAARMEARRLEMERLRAEILKAEAQARQADADAAAATREQVAEPDDDRASYYPLYPWYPSHGRRPYPLHHDHPRFPPRGAYPPPRHNKKLILTPDKP